MIGTKGESANTAGVLTGAVLIAAIWCVGTAPAFAGDGATLFERDRLGGDVGGMRPLLADKGIEIGADYTGETLGVVSGGVSRRFVVDGVASLSLDADLDKALGWTGATAHASGIAIHGRGPSADMLGSNIMDISNIEARREVRLYTLWLQQSLFEGRASIRAGQIAADDEFMTSDAAGNLINGTFGWAPIASSNMTAGGPVYPLPAPGVRIEGKPLADLTIRAGVFAGNPGGDDCTGDAQICNRHGTTFSLGGGTLWMGELQYDVAAARSPVGLPGTFKVGAWHETGSFTDQFSGVADKQGDSGIYAVADQALWRRPGTEGQGLDVFLRGGYAPPDRNLVAWYVDGGFAFKGPVASRPDDTLALGIAYAGISGDAADADRAAGAGTPVRDYESVIELSYTATLAPWWTVQPDIQYVIHPNGGVTNPAGTGTVKNAIVVGVRTSISF